MIDFISYEEVKLEDIAEFERSKTGHIYPAGASFIQVSASRGQVGYLYKKGEIESKNVVIIPKSGIDMFYFNIILKKNIDEFLHRYASGINVQEKEIGNFPIQLHNHETQKAIAGIVKEMDNRCYEQENEIAKLKEFKKTLLSEMFI
ncbi:restriction endonuclease subunit S [Vagococcus fluvialis]|uniref:restriction endonuclease subunit S n=1 Tax=Vagococcus fluvialis TaxID=2738 RepID=UPI003B5971D0